MDTLPEISIATAPGIYRICDFLSIKDKMNFIIQLISSPHTRDIGCEVYGMIKQDINNQVDVMIKKFKWNFPEYNSDDVDDKRKEAVRRYFHDDNFCKHCGHYASRNIRECYNNPTLSDMLYLTTKSNKLVCYKCLKAMYREEKCDCGKPAMLSSSTLLLERTYVLDRSRNIPRCEINDNTFPYLGLKCGSAPDGFPGCCGIDKPVIDTYYHNGKEIITANSDLEHFENSEKSCKNRKTKRARTK